DDAVAHPVAPHGLAQGHGQGRAAHRHGNAQFAEAALQAREMALGVGQLAAHHRPHLVDPVAELVAAVLDRNPRFRLAQEAAVHIGQSGHQSSSSSSARAEPTPSDFSLRCKAERSMPMKAAVREMLPPKRMIWALRYSRSNTSRASRSGRAMIRSGPTAPADPAAATSAGSISAVITSCGSPVARISRRSMLL